MKKEFVLDFEPSSEYENAIEVITTSVSSDELEEKWKKLEVKYSQLFREAHGDPVAWKNLVNEDNHVFDVYYDQSRALNRGKKQKEMTLADIFR
jgi:hypothetical protein